MRPIAITHYSVCNALGRNTESVLTALYDGRVGVTSERPFPKLSPSGFVCPLARTGLDTPEPYDLPAGDDFPTRQDLLSRLGSSEVLGATRAAVERHGAPRVGVILGTSTGGIEASERAYAAFAATRELPSGYSAHEHHALDAAAQRIALAVGATGPVFAVSTACSSSAKALASAARLLRAGFVEAALVAGVDSLCLLTLMGFRALGVVDSEGARPFAQDRRGMNVGEGAAFLLLERDAPASAYLLSAGETNDAHHMAHPHPEGDGARRAMSRALADAGVDPGRVDYVNAHGTGTQANDAAEAKVLAELFARGPLVSSTKGQTGHLLGASGATEAAFCVAAIERQRVPGNRGVTNPELGVELAPVARERRVDFALSNSLAFGGSNAALLFASERAVGSRLPSSLPSSGAEATLARLIDLRDAGEANEVELLSPRALGRASPLTRLFAKLLSRLSLCGVDVRQVPQVFGSAYGEMHTTLELLDLEVRRGESSPLRFQHSVHNAAQGVLSIAVGHRGFATSLSAGHSTTAMALLEACALLANGEREVVVLLAEEAAPAPLSTASYGPVGVALQLRREPLLGAPRLVLEHGSLGAASPLVTEDLPEPELRESPLADALRLAGVHRRGARAALSLGGGGVFARARESSWILHYAPPRSA